MSRSAMGTMSMDIHADDIYRQYAPSQNTEELFRKAAAWISKIHLIALDDKQQDVVNEEAHNTMTRVIFGSNMIEYVGLGYEATQPELKGIPAQYIQQSRDEILQRAKAFQDIIHAFVTEK
ncbi:hypothetical protein F4776DRAFT_659820 [Hypoxylon sp. NC0597]|nr:hypothetical protein F4776DRAFT_659820 [Hypoxylon sp. NC0597]